VQTLTQHFERFIERFDRLTDDVGVLKEITLEWQHRDRAPAYFGSPRFRRVRALSCEQVEVSWGVGTSDVYRAIRRADRLKKVRGFERVFPAVAGHWIGAEAREIATHSGVVQVMDGAVTWPEGNSKEGE